MKKWKKKEKGGTKNQTHKQTNDSTQHSYVLDKWCNSVQVHMLSTGQIR